VYPRAPDGCLINDFLAKQPSRFFYMLDLLTLEDSTPHLLGNRYAED